MSLQLPSSHAILEVRVQPRAGRDQLAGERDGRLLVKVSAPPEGGKANAAVCKLITKTAGVAKSRVTVIRGHTGRDKTVKIDGIAGDALRLALGLEPDANSRPID